MSRKQTRDTQPAKSANMKKLEHRGYTIVQGPRNHHVMIGKDGCTGTGFPHTLETAERRQ